MKKGKSYTIDEVKEKLANYCAYQDGCHYEVERKLNEFFLIPEAKDEIIVFLIRKDFLNEERFAKSYVRGKFYYKDWGRRKIKNELKKRNINERLIKTAFKEIDEEDYISTLHKLIEKKEQIISYKNEFEKNSKLINYLLQKGYEYELIKECLTNIQ